MENIGYRAAQHVLITATQLGQKKFLTLSFYDNVRRQGVSGVLQAAESEENLTVSYCLS